MVYASNPRLMNRVLDAVVHLCEGKGSTARDVLDFLRQTSKSTPRNLTMQVHRALKHAVNAGLLRHRSGRYKAVFTLNPAPIKQPVNENNEQKSADGMNTFDKQQTSSKSQSSDKKENRRSHYERRRKRSHSRQRKRKRRSESRKSDELKDIDKIRKLKYKEKSESVRSPRHKIPNRKIETDIGNTSDSPNRKGTKTKRRDPSNYSDLSDYSDYEDRKIKVRRRNSTYQDSKRDESGKQNRRSISRHRSPQRQQSQQLSMKYSNNDDKGSKLNVNDGENDEVQDGENDHEPDNSGSGSIL
ncbi:hypothetical protein QLX08_007057 [Tetragonisca angustula]|uniref:H15 domain-containing protein n=1 Tax=Tetragonisca angustula TaxID=166442 RepID=A0AAW0ZQQ7_9HYME